MDGWIVSSLKDWKGGTGGSCARERLVVMERLLRLVFDSSESRIAKEVGTDRWAEQRAGAGTKDKEDGPMTSTLQVGSRRSW